MITGSGQLAKIFNNFSSENSLVIFASGVSNSNCKDQKEYEREKQLLLKTLNENHNKKFIYFSSCALSSQNYQKNEYYNHKDSMEKIIKEYSNSYYIFRVPQLFGELKKHKTLINFLYESIKNEQVFQVYDEAYRYVIEIDDVRKIVEGYLKYSRPNITIDISNTYRYKVLDIVTIFEGLLGKKAHYETIDKEDKYLLDLTEMVQFIDKYNINVEFGVNYLSRKLTKKLKKD